jgi:hypothetical membrane protein
MPAARTRLIIRSAQAGLGVLCVGIVWTAVHFKNTDDTAFNPLRNFVSELGSEKASPRAGVFNTAIIIGSLLFSPLVYSLTSLLDGKFRRFVRATALCCLLGSIGVGFASMDHLKPHLAAAMLFFWGWLAMTSAFTIGLWRKYSFRHARGVVISGLVSMLLAASFLAVLITALVGFLNGAFKAPQNFQRPAVWDIAVLEWCVVASFCVWIALAARHLRRSPPRSP